MESTEHSSGSGDGFDFASSGFELVHVRDGQEARGGAVARQAEEAGIEGGGDLADEAFPVDKPGYLRDRTIEEMRAQFLAGMSVAGSTSTLCFDSEVQALAELVARSDPGDVAVITIAEQLPELQRWLRDRGGEEVDPSAWLAR